MNYKLQASVLGSQQLLSYKWLRYVTFSSLVQDGVMTVKPCCNQVVRKVWCARASLGGVSCAGGACTGLCEEMGQVVLVADRCFGGPCG